MPLLEVCGTEVWIGQIHASKVTLLLTSVPQPLTLPSPETVPLDVKESVV